jgi:Family of unknown function (DUF5677)
VPDSVSILRELFGYPGEWRRFHERHPDYGAAFDRLKKISEDIFRVPRRPAPLIDSVLYHLGLVCLEELKEVLVLSGNGLGIAAEKITRGLFEKGVTLRHIVRHPGSVNDFVDYGAVNRYKAAEEIRVWGSGSIPQDWQTEVRAGRDAFLRRNPGFKRWSKRDIVSMAHEDPCLSKMVFSAWYRPLFESHATVNAIESRLDPTSAAEFSFSLQPERADDALANAHFIILQVFRTLIDHFRLTSAEATLELCSRDWSKNWAPTRAPEA